MCQEFVKQRLRAPSTAKFPYITANGVSSVHQGEGRYMVRAYVDAQNTFGAMLRSNWTCDIRFEGNGWRALDVEIRDP